MATEPGGPNIFFLRPLVFGLQICCGLGCKFVANGFLDCRLGCRFFATLAADFWRNWLRCFGKLFADGVGCCFLFAFFLRVCCRLLVDGLVSVPFGVFVFLLP